MTLYVCDIGGSYLAPGDGLVWAKGGRKGAARLPREEAITLMTEAVRFIRAYYAGDGRPCPKLACTIRPAKGGSPITWDMPK